MALCAFLALFLHKNRIIMAEFADILIRWYDGNKRDLPWRPLSDMDFGDYSAADKGGAGIRLLYKVRA